jgi:hypothetical protein
MDLCTSIIERYKGILGWRANHMLNAPAAYEVTFTWLCDYEFCSSVVTRSDARSRFEEKLVFCGQIIEIRAQHLCSNFCSDVNLCIWEHEV